MAVLTKALFPIACFLVVLSMFLSLSAAVSGDSFTIPTLSNFLDTLTKSMPKIEFGLFSDMGKIIEALPDRLHVDNLNIQEDDSSILKILKGIGKGLFTFFIAILQLIQIATAFIDILIHISKTLFSVFGDLFQLW